MDQTNDKSTLEIPQSEQVGNILVADIFYPRCDIYGKGDYIQIDVKLDSLLIKLHEELKVDSWDQWLHHYDQSTDKSGIHIFNEVNISSCISPEYDDLTQCDQRNKPRRIAYRPYFSGMYGIEDSVTTERWDDVIHASVYSDFFKAYMSVYELDDNKIINDSTIDEILVPAPDIRFKLSDLIDEYMENLTSAQYKETMDNIALIPVSDQSFDITIVYPVCKLYGDEFDICVTMEMKTVIMKISRNSLDETQWKRWLAILDSIKSSKKNAELVDIWFLLAILPGHYLGLFQNLIQSDSKVAYNPNFTNEKYRLVDCNGDPQVQMVVDLKWSTKDVLIGLNL